MNCRRYSIDGKPRAGLLRCALAVAECTKSGLCRDRANRVKGPGLRIDLDVRRVWRCAKCGKTVRTPVQVVAQRCNCPDGPWMTLQPPVKREPFRPPFREPLPEVEPAPAQPVSPSGTAVPVVEEPSVIFPVAEPVPAGPAAETPETAAGPAPSVTETPAATPEPAAAAPAASAPGAPAAAAPEPAAASPPPDDFGAGLSEVSPTPPV